MEHAHWRWTLTLPGFPILTPGQQVAYTALQRVTGVAPLLIQLLIESSSRHKTTGATTADCPGLTTIIDENAVRVPRRYNRGAQFPRIYRYVSCSPQAALSAHVANAKKLTRELNTYHCSVKTAARAPARPLTPSLQEGYGEFRLTARPPPV